MYKFLYKKNTPSGLLDYKENEAPSNAKSEHVKMFAGATHRVLNTNKYIFILFILKRAYCKSYTVYFSFTRNEKIFTLYFIEDLNQQSGPPTTVGQTFRSDFSD